MGTGEIKVARYFSVIWILVMIDRYAYQIKSLPQILLFFSSFLILKSMNILTIGVFFFYFLFKYAFALYGCYSSSFTTLKIVFTKK